MYKKARNIIQGMLQSCSDIEHQNSKIEFVNPKYSRVQQEKTTNIQAHRKKGENNSSCQMSPSMQAARAKSFKLMISFSS